jgi:SnoaL-like domain
MLDTKDIVEIQQLESLLQHAIDHPDQSLFPLVFTEDARWDARGCGGPLLEGIEAIQALFALGKPPHPPAHHTVNCWVHEKDGKVMAKLKWLIPNTSNGQFIGGDDNDWVVKTGDGWRIKERAAVLRFPLGATVEEALEGRG